MKKNWWKWALGAFGMLIVIGAIFGEAESENGPPDPVKITMKAPSTVKAPTVEVDGRVSPADAKLTIDDVPIALKASGRFTTDLELDRPGNNDFAILAKAPGRKADRMLVSIEREYTKREIAAAREAERQRRIRQAAERERQEQARIAREAQAREDFIASATTIDYDQLAKNPDDHIGTKVAYTGQIFQIQEDYGTSVILLAVTDEGYGYWSDNVWVDYNGEIEGAEDDVITIYGVVKGEKSYETQIGGETFVPQIRARYIDE